ncbi:MAG: hypothetical protein GY754_05925 [bacterium]|nr:hypothetical protein [bacterium]
MSLGIIFHIALMDFTAALLVIALIFARKKKGSDWLKKHRLAAAFGVVTAISGALVIFFHKQAAESPHFSSPHAIGGFAAVILILLVAVFGILLAKGSTGLRSGHNIMGKVAVFAVLITAGLGAFSLLQILRIL